MWPDSLEKNNFLEETLVTGHFLQSVANQLISLPIVVLFKLKATAFATRLSLNSIHPSINSFRPLPPCFFLFFLTATSENENYKWKNYRMKGLFPTSHMSENIICLFVSTAVFKSDPFYNNYLSH